jgi:hypothetical protein
LALTAILAKAFGVPILGALGKWITHTLVAGMEARGRDYWLGIMESRKLIQQSIDEIRRATNASRVVILQAHNGNAPRPGSQLKSSVVFESYDNKTRPIMADWQLELIDQEYAEILTDVLAKGHIVIRRSEMSPLSTLQRVYETHGIAKSHVVLLSQENDRMVYASINFAQDSDIGNVRREAIRAGTSRLRGLFTDPKRRWRI